MCARSATRSPGDGDLRTIARAARDRGERGMSRGLPDRLLRSDRAGGWTAHSRDRSSGRGFHGSGRPSRSRRSGSSRHSYRPGPRAPRELAMHILFETHSTSIDNELELASGHRDVDLSPRGEMQAASLGQRRANDGIDIVYVSDLRRSWRTAEIAFPGTQLRIVRDSRLRECDYGTLTGHPVDEITAARPAAVFTPFPGGESYADATRRVAQWLDEVRQKRFT